MFAHRADHLQIDHHGSPLIDLLDRDLDISGQALFLIC